MRGGEPPVVASIEREREAGEFREHGFAASTGRAAVARMRRRREDRRIEIRFPPVRIWSTDGADE